MPKGTCVEQDYACFDTFNMQLLAGQVAVCDECQKQLQERDGIIQKMMENQERPWYGNPWLWLAVGVTLGVGGTIAIK